VNEDGPAPKTPAARPSLWAALWRRPERWWLLGIPAGALVAFLGGAGFLVAFVSAVEMSSTETFCISCHEMRDNVYAEYQQTIHYGNRSGVRATCPDCHVPTSWGPKLMRKIGATFNELPAHVLGRIDTPEEFAQHREAMAESVWAGMRKTDSRECREKRDKTCIDCHQGIAHKLPDVAATESSPAD